MAQATRTPRKRTQATTANGEPRSARPKGPDLKIAATPRLKVTVDLVGTLYTVSPPKASLALSLAQVVSGTGVDMDNITGEQMGEVMEAMDDLLQAAFGDQSDAVRARMDDPGDDLDLPHIMELVKQLSAWAAQHPST